MILFRTMGSGLERNVDAFDHQEEPSKSKQKSTSKYAPYVKSVGIPLGVLAGSAAIALGGYGVKQKFFSPDSQSQVVTRGTVLNKIEQPGGIVPFPEKTCEDSSNCPPRSSVIVPDEKELVVETCENIDHALTDCQSQTVIVTESGWAKAIKDKKIELQKRDIAKRGSLEIHRR